MKGYDVSSGYMGYLGDGRWMLFASSSDYREYMNASSGAEDDPLPESA